MLCRFQSATKKKMFASKLFVVVMGTLEYLFCYSVDTVAHKNEVESNTDQNSAVEVVGLYLKHKAAIEDVVHSLVNINIRNGQNV